MKLILIKYGELTTKKGNRKTFIRLLEHNIRLLLSTYQLEITALYDRMYISSDQLDEVAAKLRTIFGIHAIIIANRVDTTMESIANMAKELMATEDIKTFKVETKRSYKGFALDSYEVSQKIGGIILKAYPLTVNVHQPDLILRIEIHKDYTYLYTNELKGAGGYPVGIEGKGLLMLSGGIDSPVAGYLALKRGIDLECLYFESLPHTSLEARAKVIKLASLLNHYSGNIILNVIPFTKIQEAIYQYGDPTYNITIMRRMMYRIATELAKKHHCKAIINGECVGQVASQTLTSMDVINEVTNYPIIRPVVCMDKLDIIALAKQINTYETSILPYEDCCTIFLPEHPVINPHLSKCLEAEAKFDYEALIKESLEQVIIIKDLEVPKTALL